MNGGTVDADTAFVPGHCPKCRAPVLTGSCGGLRWRMAGLSVPAAHAAILKQYGVTLLVLSVGGTGAIWADVWDPAQHDLTNRYLTAPHICGAAVNGEQEHD